MIRVVLQYGTRKFDPYCGTLKHLKYFGTLLKEMIEFILVVVTSANEKLVLISRPAKSNIL